MIRAFTILGALAISATAQAEIVQADLSVPGGAEARINLGVWPSNGWSVQQFSNLIEVRFPNSQIEIAIPEDISAALPGRVREVTSEIDDQDTFLRLTLDCDCSVALQGDGQGNVGIVFHGTPRTAAHSAKPSTPAPDRAPVPMIKPDQTALAAADEKPEGTALDVEEARERLLEQLLKAADAGIVDLQDPPVEPVEQPDLDASAVSSPAASQIEQIVADAEEPQTPVADPKGASDSTRQPEQDAASNDEQTDHHQVSAEQALTCFSAEALTFPDIVNQHEFLDALANQNRQLVGEFDRPNSDAAIAQVKQFLSLGLAHEARALLTEFEPDHPDKQLYADIADLLITGDPATSSILGRTECLGDQAVWRAYVKALEGDGQAALEAEIASGRSLERLPLHLRQVVAARIGIALAKAGKWDEARRLEAIALRAANSADETLGETLLLSAELADWHGDGQHAAELISEARDRQPTSDIATLELANRWLRDHEPHGLDVAGLQLDLAAIARREKGTEKGALAFELEARLASEFASREELVQLLTHGVATGLLPEESQAALMTDLIAAPAQTGSDQPLALAFLEQPNRFRYALEEKGFRKSLARSMAEVGAPSLAKPILKDGDLDDLPTTLAMIDSYIDVGQTQDAFDLAATLPEGPEKRHAQAAAMLASGQLDGAGKLLLAQDDNADEDRRSGLLKKLKRAAVAAGKPQLAVQSAEAILAHQNDADLAQQSAILALEAGHESMPEHAARVLLAEDAEAFAAMDLLFRPVTDETAATDAETVSNYLTEMDAEMAVIRELLEDG